jgi:hypothetical protein
MKPDLSGDVLFGVRSMNAALATVRATEKRAEFLLALAKAPPDLLDKARGIYERAGARARKIQARLDQLVGANHNLKS